MIGFYFIMEMFCCYLPKAVLNIKIEKSRHIEKAARSVYFESFKVIVAINLIVT